MEQHVYEQFNDLEDRHWWFCARRSYLERIIKMLFQPDQKNLRFCEIGAGTGGNLPLLSQYSRTDAVELNDAARKIIESKAIDGVRNVYSGYLPNNMPRLDKYDAIFSLDVIEHVQDDKAALSKLKTYVKDSGYLITTVPAYQWLWSDHDVANQHFRRYTLKKYLSLFKQVDLEIVYASYFNTLLFPLAAGTRFFDNLKSKSDNLQNANLKMPNPMINKILRKIFELESRIAGKVRIPFGLSIIVVAKHPTIEPK